MEIKEIDRKRIFLFFIAMVAKQLRLSETILKISSNIRLVSLKYTLLSRPEVLQ